MIKIYVKNLSDEERSYKELHRAAYSLLSDAVSVCLGISITEDDILRTERGKPYFRAIPLHFGIAHCTGCAVCGISDTPIGIDCETVRKYRERTARYAFTPAECEYIEASEDIALTFSRMWSLKESYVKFTGTGLAGHMNDAVFLSCGEYPEAVTACKDAPHFRQLMTESGIILSICTEQSSDIITLDNITIL